MGRYIAMHYWGFTFDYLWKKKEEVNAEAEREHGEADMDERIRRREIFGYREKSML